MNLNCISLLITLDRYLRNTGGCGSPQKHTHGFCCCFSCRSFWVQWGQLQGLWCPFLGVWSFKHHSQEHQFIFPRLFFRWCLKWGTFLKAKSCRRSPLSKKAKGENKTAVSGVPERFSSSHISGLSRINVSSPIPSRMSCVRLGQLPFGEHGRWFMSDQISEAP